MSATGLAGEPGPDDADLARLVAAWADLPPAVRAGIAATVRGAAQGT